jgi:hypothetical protein
MATLTAPISTGAHDAFIQVVGTTFGGSNTATVVEDTQNVLLMRNGYTGSLYARECILMRFDTSSLGAGATVTAAQLDIRTTTDRGDAETMSFAIDWLADPGSPFVYPDDFSTTYSGTAKASALLSTTAVSTTYNWSLLNAAANVNKTGYTCLRMGVIGGSPISLNNYVNFYAYEHASEPAPQLVVTYTSGLTPPYVSVSIA